jgi:YtoQ family protein
MQWNVYLAGEIHSDWRDRIVKGARDAGLDVTFSAPVTDHPASDECGVRILGDEEKDFWKDHKGAKLNAVRTRTHLKNADIVIVRFAGEYREWNAALDAGQALAMGTPYIVMHDPSLTHALKEVDAGAQAVCETPEQAVHILKYVIAQA